MFMKITRLALGAKCARRGANGFKTSFAISSDTIPGINTDPATIERRKWRLLVSYRKTAMLVYIEELVAAQQHAAPCGPRLGLIGDGRVLGDKFGGIGNLSLGHWPAQG